MQPLEELAREREFDRYHSALGTETDPVMMVLRGHLYSENLLERLIIIKLPRGDKVVESGNLTYHQKLILVEAFACVSDAITSSLRNLNKLRNQCAHDLQKRIADSDITRVGSALGKTYTKFKRDANFDDAMLLRRIIDYLIGYLTASCFSFEHPEVLVSEASQKMA